MIPVSESSVQLPETKSQEKHDENWQDLLKNSHISPTQLLEQLELPESLLEGAMLGDQLFSLKVPKPYLDRITKGDPNDPLLLQILPQAKESLAVEGYVLDPLQEKDSNPIPGLIHKYKSRVLLVGSGACAINCRYCFRRHFPYQDNGLSNERMDQVVNYLKQHPEINEVILSGGDPLATPDKRLQLLVEKLDSVAHLKRLRIHTRLPVVIPQRITDQLLETLTNSRLKTVWVLHINHANEIDRHVQYAISKLTERQMPVLNQSVILRGVNDDVEALAALSERLFDSSIQPYYLHAFDPVQGASHFDVSDAEALQLWQSLQKELPGFLVPKLVREEPGKAHKTIMA